MKVVFTKFVFTKVVLTKVVLTTFVLRGSYSQRSYSGRSLSLRLYTRRSCAPSSYFVGRKLNRLKNYLLLFGWIQDLRSGIQYGENADWGSGKNIPDPQHWYSQYGSISMAAISKLIHMDPDTDLKH